MHDDPGKLPYHHVSYDGRSDPSRIKPEDEEEAASPEGPSRGVLARAFSVLPFLLVAVVGLIAIVSWILIVVLGVGDTEPIWRWAQGASIWHALGQLTLAILIGLVPVLVVVVASWATARGFREDSGRQFWVIVQALWGLAAVGLIVLDRARHDWLTQLGLSSFDWWFAFGVVAFAMIMAGVRVRQGRAARRKG